MAPDELKDAESDVEITQDPVLSKKIWIEHLINGQRVYAVLHTFSEDALIYKVPAQTVGGYLVNFGCVIFNKNLNNCVVALNNKGACFGMSQKDYDKGVSITKKGSIKVGDIDVNGSNGTVKTDGIDINNGAVNIDTKKIMAGVQYVGEKMSGKKMDDDDDKDAKETIDTNSSSVIVNSGDDNVSVNKNDVKVKNANSDVKVNNKKIIIKNKKQN